MRTCAKCNIQITDPSSVCPLCKSVLIEFEGPETDYAFPATEIDIKKYHFMKRLLIFLSVVVGAASLVINFLLYDGFLWSLITVAGILYLWAVISHSVANHINIASKILVQAFLGSIFIVLIDYLAGYRGWSVNYVIPSIFSAADVAVVIIILINRMDWRNYLLYQFVIALLGFVPLVLYWIHISNNPVFVIICTSLSALSLLGTAVFGDKTVKSELRRRLHF
ncbi:MAG: hypothetical protein JW817_00255 [Clostridiales bacterium]|nr:hypothetical protein [Clostridiales bacterium]